MKAKQCEECPIRSRLTIGLRNCLAYARREQRRIERFRAIGAEDWGCIIRFCEEAGVTTSILRSNAVIDESNALRAQGFMEGVKWEREGKRETFAEQLAHVGNGCINYPNVQRLIAGIVEIEGSQKAAAARIGVSPQYLNDILRGRREISDQMARRFRLRRVVIFEKDADSTGG